MTKSQFKTQWTANRAEVQAAASKLSVRQQVLEARYIRLRNDTRKSGEALGKLRQCKTLLGQRVAQLAVIDMLLKDIAKW